MSFRASQGLEDVHPMQNPLLLHGAKIALAPQSETNRTWREAKAKHSSLNRSGGLKMPEGKAFFSEPVRRFEDA